MADPTPRNKPTHDICFVKERPGQKSYWTTTRAEAQQHARRLYEENAGPFEFEHDGDRVGPFHAREVVS